MGLAESKRVFFWLAWFLFFCGWKVIFGFMVIIG